MTSIAIIPGSVRLVRAGEQVVRWTEEQARQVDGVQTVFFDLHDHQLPPFAEEMPPLIQTLELPEAARLRTNIEANDAVIFVISEYSHLVPAAPKNAIDYLSSATLKEKAVDLVGHLWHGAVKSLEHLRKVVSVLGVEVREQQVDIDLGPDFRDGIFQPSDELNVQTRALLALLA